MRLPWMGTWTSRRPAWLVLFELDPAVFPSSLAGVGQGGCAIVAAFQVVGLAEAGADLADGLAEDLRFGERVVKLSALGSGMDDPGGDVADGHRDQEQREGGGEGEDEPGPPRYGGGGLLVVE